LDGDSGGGKVLLAEAPHQEINKVQWRRRRDSKVKKVHFGREKQQMKERQSQTNAK